MTAAVPPELALLALFRSEVAHHTVVLEEGLAGLKQNPNAVKPLERMKQEVHAIWGGARIVELESIVHLAQAMKESLLALQIHKITLSSAQLDCLTQIIILFHQLAETAVEEIVTWVKGHQAEIERLIVTISGLVAETLTRTELVEQPQNSVALSTQVTDSDNRIITDPALLGLFLSEVEAHTVILNEGLLALEINPSATEQLAALMRSAHSIKGAARVVGLEMVIKLAHLMEDCFVAAQQGKLTFVSEHIDILLHSVDRLTTMAQVVKSGTYQDLTQLSQENESLTVALNSILTGSLSPIPLPVTQSISELMIPKMPPPSLTPAVESISQSAVLVNGNTEFNSPAVRRKALANTDRTVKVTATKIERLMGLAGEIVVSTRWLSPFSESLLALKKSHIELARILEKLQETSEHEQTFFKWVKKAQAKTKECKLFLAEKLNQLDIFTSHTTTHSDHLYHEMIGVRMRPFADSIQGYPRMVRDLARELGKKVHFEMIGKTTEVDQDIQEKLEAPLNHLLRNALDHGIEFPEERLAIGKAETGYLRLEIGHRSGMLMITVADDGRGLDLARLRQKIAQKKLASVEMIKQLTETELINFLFLPGFSTMEQVTEISGRGVGLDVVHNMVHEVGGVVRAVSTPGKGMSFQLELPITLSVVRTFLVTIAGEPFAFPLARIERCLKLPKANIERVEDRQYFRFGNTNIALIDIHDVLDKIQPTYQQNELAVVVISDRLNAYGLVVDKFLGECDLVVRPLDPRLGKVANMSAAAIMLDGSPVLIFDIDDLVRSIDNLLIGKRLRKLDELSEPSPSRRKRVLVVDDSITVREMERKILENQGYEVEVAVDGIEGWNAIRIEHFDLLVSDVDMPRMNGIDLISRIRQHEELKSLPIIIISYKDSKEHRLQGLEAGANYYLTKSSFEDNSFIEAIVDLIGEA
ncbi:response regulator receiver domain protein [Thioploca ingrica]|uniref:Chemotaxis protein CheA n=1 Tax=Thioploca ingrica TaxID=40754 RepID=A0A090AM19_9GAMM|nr:response regulator receiver domain protein [Thioploca ingrica]